MVINGDLTQEYGNFSWGYKKNHQKRDVMGIYHLVIKRGETYIAIFEYRRVDVDVDVDLDIHHM